MHCLYKICAAVLIIAVLNLQMPIVAAAAQGAGAEKAGGITINLPEKLATPEENIPTGKTSWWWWAAAALAVGVAAAAAGGGGGGGDTSTTSTGSVAVGW